jgi:hypothetical protein
MKKSIFGLALIGVFISASSFKGGGEEKINQQVLTSFQQEFKGATGVKWVAGNELDKAGFVLNESRVEAYFRHDGEFVGSVRNLLYNNLPLVVIKSITDRFNDAPVYEILEFNMNGDTFYYMTVETAAKKLQVKVSQSGDLTVVKRLKK